MANGKAVAALLTHANSGYQPLAEHRTATFGVRQSSNRIGAVHVREKERGSRPVAVGLTNDPLDEIPGGFEVKIRFFRNDMPQVRIAICFVPPDVTDHGLNFWKF